MIYPSRYLMNLLWVAKLFMSLIAKFLHASLSFLASEPKSNSAWRNTHIHVHIGLKYTYLTQSHQNLHTSAQTQPHARTMISICARLYTNPYFMRWWGAEVFSAAGLALVKTKDQHGDKTSRDPIILACQGLSSG